jgi:hypothetical protein
VEENSINHEQAIILIAEAYDHALLASVEWLCERFSVGIACYRLTVATDSSFNAEYLVCSTVYPAPELVNEALPRKRRDGKSTGQGWANWESALAGISNRNVSSFFQSELSAGQESYLRKRMLIYRLSGKVRWEMTARSSAVYVWQKGRFYDDINYWETGLGQQARVGPVKDGTCLRLYLTDHKDFQFFKQTMREEASRFDWDSSAIQPEDSSFDNDSP